MTKTSLFLFLAIATILIASPLTGSIFADKNDNKGKAEGCEKSNDKGKAEEKNPHCKVLEEPIITPTANGAFQPFIITDLNGRIQQGDVAFFYLEGSDIQSATSALNIVISFDGVTLSGQVPLVSPVDAQYFVSVRPSIDDPARFSDLPFFVTAGTGGGGF